MRKVHHKPVAIGTQFGKLTTCGPTIPVPRKGYSDRFRYKYPCVCECGNRTEALLESLKAGRIVSCGCWAGGRKGKTPVYCGLREAVRADSHAAVTWMEIRKRCFTKSHPKYPSYGGRGITVCQEWLGPDGFITFLRDMGEPPAGRTLGRIHNDGPYCPANCRWETPVQQANNSRWNRHVEIKGIVDTVANHARRYGFKYEPFRRRLANPRFIPSLEEIIHP